MANSIGVIDRTYNGEIMMALIKADKKVPDLKLPICLGQLILRPIIHVEVIKITEKELEETTRGEGGFGSTGK